ncbi:RnfABCDGE type electron transport complex subunit D [Pseudoalteromonas sp. Hal099]
MYLIRTFGGFPDAVAFSVLLINIAVPLIDSATPNHALMATEQ